MRITTRFRAAAIALVLVALQPWASAALAQTQRAAPHAPRHGHGAHGGVHHPRPAVVWGPSAAPAAPSLSPIEPVAPAPRPYGGCIPTGPVRDSYGGVVSGGC